MRCIRLVLAAWAASFLAACALQPIPYDKQTAGEIKTIGVVTPHIPSQPAVILATSVGQSFGLIGGLVDAAMQESRQTKFKAAIEPHNFSPQDACLTEVTARLEELGYSVVMVPVERPSQDFLKTYPPENEPKVDAYLDLVLSYGYVAAGIGSTPYRPVVYVTARLVRASDASVLMQDAVSYNRVGPYAANSKALTIPPDPAYSFANFDRLVGDPATAVQGMEISITQSVKPIGQLLK